MLLRHALSYLAARGIPGILQFAALAIFTRLITPDEYGVFVMAIAVIGLVNAVGFQWLRLGLLRFYNQSSTTAEVLRATLGTGYGIVMGITALGAGCWAVLQPDDESRALVLIGVLLLWWQAWFELNQEIARAQLSPRVYGILGVVRSALYISVGVVLTLWLRSAFGLLLAMLVSFGLPGLWMVFRHWQAVRGVRRDSALLAEVARYGLPLTATFVLVFIVSTSDRLLLGWMIDEEAAGLYGVGYDLAQNSIGMLLMVVNLAAYPLVLRALEKEGRESAQRQLAQNGTLLLAVALPASVAVAVMAPAIASVCVGVAFQPATTALLPWVAVAALLTGFRAYHLDLSFHLSKKTLHQTVALGAAAVINVILNLLLIPGYGIMGAAYATLVAYGVALIASWVLGRRTFEVPVDTGAALRIAGATIVMAGVLWPLRHHEGLVALIAQVGAGALAYGMAAAAFNVARARDRLIQIYQKRKSWSPNA